MSDLCRLSRLVLMRMSAAVLSVSPQQNEYSLRRTELEIEAILYLLLLNNSVIYIHSLFPSLLFSSSQGFSLNIVLFLAVVFFFLGRYLRPA